MEGCAPTTSGDRLRHEIHTGPAARKWGMVGVSLGVGFTALPVCFGAAAAFENSKGELIAPCVAAALYLAFCQFWVAPRGSSGFWAKAPTLVAGLAPLLLLINLPPRTWGIPWIFVWGCLGSAVGSIIAARVTGTSHDFINGGGICRRNLLVGFILLVAVALLIPIGVIPSVLAHTGSDFNARPLGIFLGVTVVFIIMADGLLASAVWRGRDHDHTSKGTLGITAFLALLLGLAYCGFGILVNGHLRVASVLLLLCALLGLITTALMTVTSVIVDRVRLSDLNQPELP